MQGWRISGEDVSRMILAPAMLFGSAAVLV
jgi:hypothetical protein